ncbi:MAG: YajQ family cyclic di-GMP-binding protein [Acidobacteria bacterium]|nr:YajQ family cyclic di-GMP-binding protein [Acidobacteriota bacterium]
MAEQNSFDIISKIDLAEVSNAINQTMKEVKQRFDFKNSKSDITLEEKDNAIILHSDDDFKVRSLNDILEQKLVKRGVPLKGLTYGKVEPAAGSTVRQRIDLQQGIPIEKAREIVKFIKDTKLKVQAAINADIIRVTGRDRDILQQIIKALKEEDFGIHMEFTNYRTN